MQRGFGTALRRGCACSMDAFILRRDARKLVNPSNVHPCVARHPAWRDATDMPQHSKLDNRLEE
jgi:hypothetical protein